MVSATSERSNRQFEAVVGKFATNLLPNFPGCRFSPPSPRRSAACTSSRSRRAWIVPSSRAPTVVVKVAPFQRESLSCGQPEPRSYSSHDTQKCGVAGADRDDIDDGSSGVDIRPHLSQCHAGFGSCGNSVLVIHLCVWLLQCGCVLLRVPSGAAVVIPARESFATSGFGVGDPSGSRSAAIWLPGGVQVGYVCFRGAGSLWGHSSDPAPEPL